MVNSNDTALRRGNTGNVIAAVASFFLPGLGQLVQGRFLRAAVYFLVTTVGYALYFLIVPAIIAFVVHVVAILDAARFRG